MKYRIGFFVLIAGAVLLAAWLSLKQAAPQPTTSAPAATTTTVTSSTSPGFESSGSTPSHVSSTKMPVANTSSSSIPQQATPANISAASPADTPAAQAVLAAIDAKADADTSESLKDLVSYASDEDKDIRSTALNGLIRRADVAAIPLLRAAAKASDSSQVTIDLLKTAEFLALPSTKMSELPAGKKTAGQQPTRPPATH